MHDYWWGRRRDADGKLQGVTVSVLGWVAMGIIIVVAIMVADLIMPMINLSGFGGFLVSLLISAAAGIGLGLPVLHWKLDRTGIYERKNGVWIRVGEVVEASP